MSTVSRAPGLDEGKRKLGDDKERIQRGCHGQKGIRKSNRMAADMRLLLAGPMTLTLKRKLKAYCHAWYGYRSITHHKRMKQ